MGQWRYRSTGPRWRWVVSFTAPAALPLGRDPDTHWEWIPELVRTLWRTEKNLFPCLVSEPCRPVRSLVTLLTELPCRVCEDNSEQRAGAFAGHILKLYMQVLSDRSHFLGTVNSWASLLLNCQLWGTFPWASTGGMSYSWGTSPSMTASWAPFTVNWRSSAEVM